LEVAIKLLGYYVDIIAAELTEDGCWSIIFECAPAIAVLPQKYADRRIEPSRQPWRVILDAVSGFPISYWIDRLVCPAIANSAPWSRWPKIVSGGLASNSRSARELSPYRRRVKIPSSMRGAKVASLA
jgi:hypothetical protein